MKRINLSSGNYLFIEVPDDVINFSYGVDSNWIYYYKKDYHNSFDHRHIEINYKTKLISTTKDITEEQAFDLVDKFQEHSQLITHYWNYVEKDWMLNTAKESLQSLIQVNGLDINKNYLILKKL